MTTTTTKTPARVMATDEKTGKRYVKTQTIEGATVTVTRFTGQMAGDKYSWSAATYDVTSPAGELFAGAITWNGKSFTVGSPAKSAGSLTKAVRAVLGTGQLPEPRPRKAAAKSGASKAPARKRSGASRKADTAAQGGSVIVKDPATGLPSIDPVVKAKADAIVAAQKARNAR